LILFPLGITEIMVDEKKERFKAHHSPQRKQEMTSLLALRAGEVNRYLSP
jgi:hypothetical protein